MSRVDTDASAGQTAPMATFGNLQTEVEPLATLMREHGEIHALVTEARELAEESLAAPGDSGLAAQALATMRRLDLFMAESLVIHIAKEEDVLFPALRGLASEMDQVVDEMVEQHDEVRFRQAFIEKTIAALDHTHDEVDAERAALAARLQEVGSAPPSVDVLATLLDGVKRLDWILQGHFGDEEDDLFVPALELLSPDVWADLAVKAAALDG